MGLAQTGHYRWRSSLIHYCRWGSGGKLLICLHGYGESAESFACLESALGQSFTMLAVDLPFHGGTQWKEGLRLGPEELQEILEGIAGELGGGSKWSFLGYSMGGRVALSLVERMPGRVARLVLAAPDGLVVNGWYKLVTRWKAGNLLFRWMMRRPGLLLSLAKALNRVRLLNKSVYTFTVNYVHDAEDRDKLYKRWTTMRGFRPDLDAFCAQVRAERIPVGLVYGRQDRIIRVEVGEQFRQRIAPYGELIVLDCGHRVLQERYAEAFVRLLEGGDEPW
ncbi:MAG: alpha/beta hydrolase [Bacteroidota bacterium]|nr:alpha/beta hydrolase [Bacteroidota bacterium]MDP4260791.1 alpha/beta hydrolase [Bacteroidota bacterium]